ncbi:alpha/beta fold hydrolase [Novosphingobium sp. ZW T3_23]|uniref:alpha/beta fold hydrolase n=1 Tax=Novosphingobium sp. ZW T3_23 TaxID=3378084 RepID=UPI003852591D
MILIHGVGLSQAMWEAQKIALRHAYRVITLDMLGHGGSPRPAAAAGLDDYADQVAELMDHLAIDKAVLIGFSMGALVARAFALRYPGRLSGLILLNGVFDRSETVRATILGRVDEVRRAGPSANSDAAIERWFTPEFRAAQPDYIAELRAHMAGNDHHGYLTSYGLFASQDNFGADRLGEIAVPTLVATGEFDVGSTPDMTLELVARIPGAKASVIAGARHMMPVEMPEETNALLLGYLSTITQQPITAGEAS